MKYRKKPVIVEAHKFDYNSDYPPWLSVALRNGTAWYQGGDTPYITIKTLEGEMRADLGDWIIQGVEGKIYPCKPSVFEATYEEAL